MSAPQSLVLEAVVEFDPFEYRKKGRTSPEVPIEADPKAWEDFFFAAMADGGVQGLSPLPGTWLIPAAELSAPELLAKLVAVHFGEADAVAFVASLPGPFDGKSGMNGDGERIEEFCPPLRGGYALRRGEEVLLAPTCCGDLSNWRNWLNATRVETESWQDLWIGHPVARVCRRDGVLFIQGVDEGEQLVGAPIILAAEDLGQAVEQAKDGLPGFADRLRGTLGADLDSELAARMVTQLSGLGEFELD